MILSARDLAHIAQRLAGHCPGCSYCQLLQGKLVYFLDTVTWQFEEAGGTAGPEVYQSRRCKKCGRFYAKEHKCGRSTGAR